jgi:hypothetical protein
MTLSSTYVVIYKNARCVCVCVCVCVCARARARDVLTSSIRGNRMGTVECVFCVIVVNT